MPTGYRLDPNIQMKIEDERAGRLDYVYETGLTVNECYDRIGSPVSGKLSDYETAIEDGILYITFIDQKYAVRFECAADKTVIRVRYIWENDSISVQYLLKEDIDAFFESLFDAAVSDLEKKIWIDSAERFAQDDPLKIHGKKRFWIISTVFVIMWLVFILWRTV